MEGMITPTPDTPEETAARNDAYEQQYPKWWNPRWWLIAGILLFTTFVVALFIACRYWLGYPYDTPAFVAGVVGLLTLAAILMQIFVNRMQWQSMDKGLDKTECLLQQNERIIGEMKGQREMGNYQIVQTNSQLITAREQAIQMTRQVDIMQGQLETMNQQITAMHEIAFAANRGYLSIHGFHPLVIETECPQVIVTWDNDGNSPLTILDGAYVRIKLLTHLPYKGQCGADRGNDVIVSPVTVPARSPRTQVFNDLAHRWTTEELADVEAGRKILSVCGNIPYKTLNGQDALEICAFWNKDDENWYDCNPEPNPN